MHLTLRQLKYFVGVVDAGSMARAAERLHVAPTALSLQIKAMEDHYRDALLLRHSRGVRPTDLGNELYIRAQQIIGLVEQAERLVGPQRRPVGRCVRLGVPPAVARIIGVAAFVGVPKRLEGVTLQITEGWSGDLRLQLEKAELDFVVGYGLEASERIHVIDLIEDRFVFASAPDGESPDTPIALRDALQSNLIFYGEKSVSWRAARDAAEATRQQLNGEQHVTSIDLWRSLLRQGVGTSITPFGAIAEEVARGEIAVREIADQPIFRRIGIACPIELAAEAWAGAFVDVIVDLVLTGHSRTGTHYRGLDWTW